MRLCLRGWGGCGVASALAEGCLTASTKGRRCVRVLLVVVLVLLAVPSAAALKAVLRPPLNGTIALCGKHVAR